MKITEKDVGRSYIGRDGEKYKISGFDKGMIFPFSVKRAGVDWTTIDKRGRVHPGRIESDADFMRWASDEALEQADAPTDEALKGKYLATIKWDDGDNTWLHHLRAASFEQVRDNVSDLIIITEDDWGVVEMLDSAKQGTAVAFNKDVYIAGSHIGTLTIKVCLS